MRERTVVYDLCDVDGVNEDDGGQGRINFASRGFRGCRDCVVEFYRAGGGFDFNFGHFVEGK